MPIETGFDYSAYEQGQADDTFAQTCVSAGLERCCLALDTSNDTINSAISFNKAGIKLHGYRELSLDGSETTQVQNAIDSFSVLSQYGIVIGILFLTAEDTSIGVQPDILLPRFENAVNYASNYNIGVYTGGWYWPTYMGNAVDFSYLPLWAANYDGVAGLQTISYGGWSRCAAKQYASPVPIGNIGLDLDVFDTSLVR